MKTPIEPANKTANASPEAISVEDAISMLDGMMPSKEVMMRREMEQMFPSIKAALERDVSEEQVVATLRKKWPNVHVATIIKLLNAERDRRMELGEHIGCKPFGSPRKPRKATEGNQGQQSSHVHADSRGAEA